MLALVRTRPTRKPVEVVISGGDADAKDIAGILATVYEVSILWPGNSMGDAVPFRQTAWWQGRELKGIGRLITATRLKYDISQAQLATKSGIAQSRISEYETGKRKTTVRSAQRIARVLECDYHRFL